MQSNGKALCAFLKGDKKKNGSSIYPRRLFAPCYLSYLEADLAAFQNSRNKRDHTVASATYDATSSHRPGLQYISHSWFSHVRTRYTPKLIFHMNRNGILEYEQKNSFSASVKERLKPVHDSKHLGPVATPPDLCGNLQPISPHLDHFFPLRDHTFHT